LRERQTDRTLSDERAEVVAGLFWAMTHDEPGRPVTRSSILPPPEVGRRILSSPDSAFDQLEPNVKDLRQIRKSLRAITDLLYDYLPTFADEIRSSVKTTQRGR
jgi:hypothetical protein